MSTTLRPFQSTARLALVFALGLNLAGCAAVTNQWHRMLNFSESAKPLPVAVPPDLGIESSGLPPAVVRRLLTPPPVSHKELHRGPAARTSQARVTAPVETPSPVPQVTLAGEAPDRTATRRLLDQTGRRLAEIDRGKLDVQGSAAYDQVTDFLKAGRHALDNQDYFTAAGYAQKASSLASRLPPSL